MKVVKLFIKKENNESIRRFQVDSFKDFVGKVQQFASVKDINELQMKYLDEENDWVTFSSEIEFQLITWEYVKVCVSSNVKKEEKKERPFVHISIPHHVRGMCQRRMCPRRMCCPRRRIHNYQKLREVFLHPNKHWNIICDGCGIKDFEGERWKCKDCPDYDLCGKCFKNKEKLHLGMHQFGQMDTQRRWINPKKNTEEMEKMEEKVVKFVENLKDAFSNEDKVKKVEEKVGNFVKKINEVLEDEKIEEKVGDFVKKVQEVFSGNEEKVKEVPEKKEEVKKPVEKVEPQVQESAKKEKFEGPYAQQMKLLSEMGFEDYKLMEHLLKHQKGNIQKVVELLTRM